jgi:NAD+ diphosphatase
MTSTTGEEHGRGRPPAFAGTSLDRAGSLREDPARVADLVASRAAVVLAAGADGVLLDRTERPALARHPLGAGAGDLVDPDGPILLGLEDGSALFAADLDGLSQVMRDQLLASGEIVSLRDAGAILGPTESGLAAYMMALLNWHRRHRFCANCGAPTSVSGGGLVRRCANCGASHFPRTDPVVIMLVESDGRALLGSRAGWPDSRYSILAGFVEPGETPEEAVIREVREESGITAHTPRYVSSQPWPFPSSLMLGFEALSDGGNPSVGDGELTDVRWFTRDDLRAAQSGAGEIQLPPPVSIARMLIDRWVAQER